MKVRNFVWLAAVLLGIGGHAYAHHSQAMFDETKMVTLTGVVTKFAWINPHVQVYFDAKDKGKTQNWQIEANSAVTMGRAGWTRTQFKAGEKVTVSFHPARNGSAHGYLRKIIGADGKVLEMAGGTGGPPPSSGAKQPPSKP